MASEFLTQREFAALAGLSTATVVKMIANGTIKKSESGRIPKSEIIKVYINRIKKYAEYGTLIVTFDKTEEEVEILKQRFLDSDYANRFRDTVRCYSGIRDLISVVTKPSSSVNAETVQEQYNKEILSLFMQKYCQVIDAYFTSLASVGTFKTFSALSVFDAYEYLMFGKFSNESDVISSFLADTVAIKEISQYIQLRFDSIISELCLVGENGSPLFSRQSLTKEFFKREGTLYNSFFFDGEGKKNTTFLKLNQKVLDGLINSANGKRAKSSIDSILTDGFVSVINVDSSCVNLLQSSGSFVEGDILSEACCGIYSKVIITKSAKELTSNIDNNLGALPLLLEKTSSASVIYDETLN